MYAKGSRHTQQRKQQHERKTRCREQTIHLATLILREAEVRTPLFITLQYFIVVNYNAVNHIL